MGEKQGDKVYTPPWCAADMVRHFRPSGRVLDPCRGRGAFTDLIHGALWCEIDDGHDFFHWSEPVDWAIGNPPYSLTREWFRHSYRIAADIVYLVPLRNVFSGYGFIREILDYGGIRHVRLYGTGGRLGFPMGNAVGAMWLQRGYRGETSWSDQGASGGGLFSISGEAAFVAKAIRGLAEDALKAPKNQADPDPP